MAYQTCSFVPFSDCFTTTGEKKLKPRSALLSTNCKFSVYVLTGNSLPVEEVPFGEEQRAVQTPHSLL